MVTKYNTMIGDGQKNTSANTCAKTTTIPPQSTTIPPQSTTVPPPNTSVPPHPIAIIYRDAWICNDGLHQLYGCISWCSEDTYVVSSPHQ